MTHPIRHATHPSEACECPTCDLEHRCEGFRYEFAVNPWSGAMICLYRMRDDEWYVVTTNHPDGATVSRWASFGSFPGAFGAFWCQAEATG